MEDNEDGSDDDQHEVAEGYFWLVVFEFVGVVVVFVGEDGGRRHGGLAVFDQILLQGHGSHINYYSPIIIIDQRRSLQNVPDADLQQNCTVKMKLRYRVV